MMSWKQFKEALNFLKGPEAKQPVFVLDSYTGEILDFEFAINGRSKGSYDGVPEGAPILLVSYPGFMEYEDELPVGLVEELEKLENSGCIDNVIS